MLCCVVEYGEDVWRVRIIIPYIYKVYINFVGQSNAVHPVWSVQMDVRIYIYVHVLWCADYTIFCSVSEITIYRFLG